MNEKDTNKFRKELLMEAIGAGFASISNYSRYNEDDLVKRLRYVIASSTQLDCYLRALLAIIESESHSSTAGV